MVGFNIFQTRTRPVPDLLYFFKPGPDLNLKKIRCSYPKPTRNPKKKQVRKDDKFIVLKAQRSFQVVTLFQILTKPTFLKPELHPYTKILKPSNPTRTREILNFQPRTQPEPVGYGSGFGFENSRPDHLYYLMKNFRVSSRVSYIFISVQLLKQIFQSSLQDFF